MQGVRRGSAAGSFPPGRDGDNRARLAAAPRSRPDAPRSTGRPGAAARVSRASGCSARPAVTQAPATTMPRKTRGSTSRTMTFMGPACHLRPGRAVGARSYDGGMSAATDSPSEPTSSRPTRSREAAGPPGAPGAVLPRRPAGLEGPRGRLRRWRRRAAGGRRGGRHRPLRPRALHRQRRHDQQPIRIPSRKLLQQHMDAAAEIGARGLIVHGGHVNKADDPARSASTTGARRSSHRPQVPLLIENTAGGDNAMARRLDRIGGCSTRWPPRGLRRRLLPRHLPRVGRRHPARDGGRRVNAITGRIDLVHANDSRDDFDSGADRHANLGAGRIDPDLLAAGGPRRRRPGRVRDPGRRRGARRRLRGRPLPPLTVVRPVGRARARWDGCEHDGPRPHGELTV